MFNWIFWIAFGGYVYRGDFCRHTNFNLMRWTVAAWHSFAKYVTNCKKLQKNGRIQNTNSIYEVVNFCIFIIKSMKFNVIQQKQLIYETFAMWCVCFVCNFHNNLTWMSPFKDAKYAQHPCGQYIPCSRTETTFCLSFVRTICQFWIAFNIIYRKH